MKRVLFAVMIFLMPNLLNAFEVFPVQVTKNNELLFSIDAKNAQSVALAGNFNDWSADKNLLKKDELGIWSITLKLASGKYEYKFVINGSKWVPDNNLTVEVLSKYGKVRIKGGAGYAQKFEKRANLGKINDKIYLKGLYKFILINSIYNSKLSSVDNRHILDISPEIYFSDFVYSDFTLNIDTSKANYLNFWKGKLKLYTDYTAFYLFNNERIISLKDPLQSMYKYRVYEKYPVFKYPVTFYNFDSSDKFSGINLRGAEFKIKYKNLQSDFVLFRPNYKNATVFSYSIDYHFKSSKIGIIGLRESGIYEGNDYIEPSSAGFAVSPYNSSTSYFFDTSRYYGISKDYYITKAGPMFHIDLNNGVTVFGEFLYGKKQGGFFAKTLYSDGYDLPEDYVNHPSSGSYNYDKFIYFFENEFTEREFIVGSQLTGKVYKQEISFKINSKKFIDVPTYSMKYINPSSSTIKYISFFDFFVKQIKFGIINELNILVNDKNIANYNYYTEFDKLNYFNRYLSGVYNKISFRNIIEIVLNNPLKFELNFLYNKYLQNDIYFGTDTNWVTETIESYFKVFYHIGKKWAFELTARFKNYNYKELIEKNVLLSFNKLYINPFLKVRYNIFGNFNVYFEYGLDPNTDEEHIDGMAYYLNSKTDNNFPFFKTAEDSLVNNQFIGVKAELRF